MMIRQSLSSIMNHFADKLHPRPTIAIIALINTRLIKIGSINSLSSKVRARFQNCSQSVINKIKFIQKVVPCSLLGSM